MAKYEAMLVYSVDQDVNTEALKEKFADLIAANGTLLTAEPWGSEDGVRDLAYEIKFQKKGLYMLYTFECGPEFPAEFDRRVRIEDGILRSLVIKL